MKIGIDIGGSHMAIGLIDNENNIIERHEKDYTNEEKNNIIFAIENYIVEVVENFKSKNIEIEKIGIAVPGSTKNGVILEAINLGIQNYNIAKSISEKIQLDINKINVINDAKSACKAEYNCIKDENIKNMLFLAIGTGIGGGMIYNGKLMTGTKFDGCEIGHMIINQNGIPCKCGKQGCFERYGSILEYKNKVKNRLHIPPEINSDPLRAIMNEHVEEIEDLRQEYLDNLALGISNLVNIFEPDTIVIGGGFAHFAYMFMDDLKEKLVSSNLLYNKRKDIDLRVAKTQNDAAMIGAIM